jgi:putative aldouronate transport system substrate-binding protein
MKMRKMMSLLLALAMVFSLAACGGTTNNGDTSNQGDSSAQGGDTEQGGGDSQDNTETPDENGVYHADGYTYGAEFYSEEPVTYTMYFNDNDAYPIQDSWFEEGGVFDTITKMTNVTLELTIVNNNSYGEKTALDIASGTSPYIIPKIYSDAAYVDGGGVVALSEYTQYMPNYTYFYDTYDMADDVATIRQADGKYYRLPGLKETSLQDYTLLLRKDYFEAAGIDIAAVEKDWTWDEFVDDLIKVKEYMVSQGIVGENDYIWSDRWCGSDSGYGTGGCLLNLISRTYGIYTTWSSSSGTNFADLYYDESDDSFKLSATSDAYKQYMTIIQKLVDNKILDPETWSQQDATADGDFYTGKTALILTNRSQTAAQDAGLKAQLGEGNYEIYRCVIPMGTTDYQAENSRLECGLMVSTRAKNELSEEDFIKMLRFIDWLWYSDAGLTMTKWGVEGETYEIAEDGSYQLLPQYYCGGLSIAQTSDDQEDMRLKLGYACGNFMYSGSRELLTSNFSAELRDFYDRMAEYRELRPLDPTVALTEDENEQMNLWVTPLWDELNRWTLKFAMGQADIDDDWDSFVAALEAQNLQNVLDKVNEVYQASK